MTSARCHRSGMRQRKTVAAQARATAKEAKPVWLRKAARVEGPVREATQAVEPARAVALQGLEAATADKEPTAARPANNS